MKEKLYNLHSFAILGLWSLTKSLQCTRFQNPGLQGWYDKRNGRPNRRTENFMSCIGWPSIGGSV